VKNLVTPFVAVVLISNSNKDVLQRLGYQLFMGRIGALIAP
jgi:hypothetical protein